MRFPEGTQMFIGRHAVAEGEAVVTADGECLRPGEDYEFDRAAGTIVVFRPGAVTATYDLPRAQTGKRKAQWKQERGGRRR